MKPEDLGDGVYAEDLKGTIKLTSNANHQANVVYLEGGTYNALRRFAQAHGYEDIENASGKRKG